MGRPGKKHVRLGLAAPASKPLFDGFDDERSPAPPTETYRLPVGFDSSKPEESYARLVPPTHRRRLGQYFTPQPIADLLCQWAARAEPRTMLDPAAGTGILS